MQGFDPQDDQERDYLKERMFLGEDHFIELQEHYKELQEGYKELVRTPAKIIININKDTYESIEIQNSDR